jgi:serine phosphatase RsbU (regulator of sigma subunit)
MLKMLEIENFKQSDNQQNREILLRLQNLTSILQETFNTSEHIVFEEKITTFKNRKKWLQFTVSPIYQSGIQTDKAVVLCTDITAIKLAEEEISQKKDELYSQSELLKDANLELEKANQLMRNSMTYAQRIQKSMLPNLADIRTVFEDTFIFFMPKDIVSGDFYWFNKIDDSYILIVADCTGHGVPGAFMSMIGNTLLKDTVSKKMDNPAEILSYLNDGIRTTLRQKDNIDDMQSDGMDITVCIYNPKLREIQIALANHRALLIKKDEIIIVDGDIFAVGGSFTNRISIEFTNKKYSIEKGDILYMYTDGFQDQLGGTDYSKYGGSEFLKYLASIFGESFNIQFSKLKNEFLTWKNDKNQTDDVLIWGIKF